jgi:hypothetical protein
MLDTTAEVQACNTQASIADKPLQSHPYPRMWRHDLELFRLIKEAIRDQSRKFTVRRKEVALPRVSCSRRALNSPIIRRQT